MMTRITNLSRYQVMAGRGVVRGALIFLTIYLLFMHIALAQETQSIESGLPSGETKSHLLPPIDVTAKDVGSDSGGSVDVSWKPQGHGLWNLLPEDAVESDMYLLQIALDSEFQRANADGEIKDNETGQMRSVWQKAAETRLSQYRVTGLENNVPYRFRVATTHNGQRAFSKASNVVEAKDHWFLPGKSPVFITIAIFVAILIVFLQLARKGVELFVRRISGLTEVENAIGRATEMGKPVLYVPGTSSIEDVATLASLNILGEVARRTVHYDVKIICPNRDPIVYTVAREIVRETYASEGRPDAFDPDSVFFLVPDQFAYAAGVDGIMVREKPATIFFMGMFWAESLIMAETGASTGAIQMAGTDSLAQLPFFITACDYTLIGEELYAASAYLSREPLLLGTLKAQDYGKLIFMICMVLFTIIALIFNYNEISWIQVE